jgi:hypothetical protein
MDHRSQTVLVADGAADSFGGNTEKTYALYPISNAETRAEGRALKRLLRLKRVNAAEEVGATDLKYLANTLPQETEDSISEAQKKHLDIMCEKLDINVQKFLLKYGFESYNISRCTKDDAFKWGEDLNSLQNIDGQDDTVVNVNGQEIIFGDLKGYDEHWRSHESNTEST